jgi:hypothetical protein
MIPSDFVNDTKVYHIYRLKPSHPGGPVKYEETTTQQHIDLRTRCLRRSLWCLLTAQSRRSGAPASRPASEPYRGQCVIVQLQSGGLSERRQGLGRYFLHIFILIVHQAGQGLPRTRRTDLAEQISGVSAQGRVLGLQQE